MANTADLEQRGTVRKIDALFDRLRDQRNLELADQGTAFRGRVNYWVDADVTTLVVKSALATVTLAGYPDAAFVVRERGSDSLRRLPVGHPLQTR